MVVVYCTLIINGRRTYESVPDNLKPTVQDELYSMGLDTDGKPLSVDEPVA
ncbi:CD1375 family protein [Heyndrickxia camelliae]|uniref:CD1375 family protein n=1 Tax=Heyndrickxia camelliae TaxID=1707093 RepID=UPI001F22FAA6|nr:CD1375 family protein [Heyndrickxia camelliae]